MTSLILQIKLFFNLHRMYMRSCENVKIYLFFKQNFKAAPNIKYQRLFSNTGFWIFRYLNCKAQQISELVYQTT